MNLHIPWAFPHLEIPAGYNYLNVNKKLVNNIRLGSGLGSGLALEIGLVSFAHFIVTRGKIPRIGNAQREMSYVLSTDCCRYI